MRVGIPEQRCDVCATGNACDAWDSRGCDRVRIEEGYGFDATIVAGDANGDMSAGERKAENMAGAQQRSGAQAVGPVEQSGGRQQTGPKADVAGGNRRDTWSKVCAWRHLPGGPEQKQRTR